MRACSAARLDEALRRLRAQRAVVLVGEHVVGRLGGALAALRGQSLGLELALPRGLSLPLLLEKPLCLRARLGLLRERLPEPLGLGAEGLGVSLDLQRSRRGDSSLVHCAVRHVGDDAADLAEAEVDERGSTGVARLVGGLDAEQGAALRRARDELQQARGVLG